MIFESHAHYDDEAFDNDRESLLDNIRKQGIEYIVNVGANIETSKKTLELMGKYPFIYAALGVHPCDCNQLNDKTMHWLKSQYCIEKVVAVGEIGLDYYWDEPERNIQKHWFEKQLEMAREVSLPVIIHSRDAAQDTLSILKANDAEKIGGVIHCFSYGKEMAREYINMGFYIGIGGVITFQNAKKLKEAVEYISLENILLETDCPYLAPVPFRGKRNTSEHIPLIAKAIADIKKIDYETVVKVTNYNAKKLFQII